MPEDRQQAKKLCGQAVHFAVIDDILYFTRGKEESSSSSSFARAELDGESWRCYGWALLRG